MGDGNLNGYGPAVAQDEVPRVLSVQSHVVSGYCGNKSATFPLQVLGFEVDPLNSVQLSNHTGYKYWKGQVLNDKDIDELVDGLRLNGLLSRYTHILTGYARSPAFLKKLAEVIKEIKTLNPNALYVCDPVMGDFGRMYVPEDLLPVYRDEIIPLSDVVCPNQFEAEILTGIKIENESDAFKAMDALHSKGIPVVIISSSDIIGTDKLVVLGSQLQKGNPEKAPSRIRLEFPRLDVSFIGTGDLFAALTMAWLTKTHGDLKVTCEKTISTLHSIILRTIKYAEAHGGTKDWANIELKLVQSREEIENPPSIFTAQIIE